MQERKLRSMKIATSKGKTFDIRFIGATLRGGKRMMIELEDSRPLWEIAEEFDGLSTITKTDSARPGVKEIYEGFSRLVGIQRNADNGTVRLTLEKDDAV